MNLWNYENGRRTWNMVRPGFDSTRIDPLWLRTMR